ncbi:MAG: hypothetical protein ACRD6W_15035 [Nitrososphaerales archaeon]
MFVDDAVLGRLPQICIKDGVPTTDTLVVSTPVTSGGGLGIAWLLVLAGPLGWLGLVVIGAMRRPADMLTVRLPWSEAAYSRLRKAKAELWPFALGTPFLLIAALFALGRHSALLAGVLAIGMALCATRWAVALYRIRDCSVLIDLDASRRWVTLSRVHPRFAASCGRGPEPPAFGVPWRDDQPGSVRDRGW